jgi:nicotinamide riboside transporter PnuC
MLIQIAILIFGASSIWLVSRKEQWKRWGYILGLCGQPFWFYLTITTNQWGMFILTLFYTYSWIQGIYNYWIKIKEK